MAGRPHFIVDFNQVGLPDSLTKTGFVFSRKGNAWRRDTNGIYQSTPTNLSGYSNGFANATGWTLSLATIVASGVTDPFGLTQASILQETTSTGSHQVTYNDTYSINIGTTYTFSVYAKKYNTRLLQISGFGLSNSTESVNFDLGTGTVYTSGTSVVLKGSGMVPLSNGWYRCYVTVVATTTAKPSVRSTNSNSNFTSPSYAGSATDGIYIYGGMLDPSQNLNSYINTTGGIQSGNYVADYDPISGKYAALIEPPQLNLIAYSSEIGSATWTVSNATMSANGTSVIATKTPIKVTATSTAGYLTQTTSTSNAGDVLYAIVEQGTSGTADIMFNGPSVAVRVRLTFSSGATTFITDDTGKTIKGAVKLLNVGPNGGVVYKVYFGHANAVTGAAQTIRILPDAVNGNGYIWVHHVQHVQDANLFLTSPIVTAAAAASRPIETLTSTTFNTQSWYNVAQLTLFADITMPYQFYTTAGSYGYPLELTDGSAAVNYLATFIGATRAGGSLYNGGVEIVTDWNSGVTPVPGSSYRLAISAQNGQYYFSINGNGASSKTGSQNAATPGSMIAEIGSFTKIYQCGLRYNKIAIYRFAYGAQAASGSVGGANDLTA